MRSRRLQKKLAKKGIDISKDRKVKKPKKKKQTKKKKRSFKESAYDIPGVDFAEDYRRR